MSITQYKRLHVLYDDYSYNPTRTIQSFIGNDAEIIKVNENGIISDGYVVVDVEYKVLDLDPTKTYYIKFGDCRKINMKKDNCYIVKVDDINVCVNIRKPNIDKDKYIPIIVNAIIPNSRDSVLYKYYGQITDSPFHYCNSQMFSHNHELKTLDECNKCNTDKSLFTDEQVKASYNDVIGKLPFNSRTAIIASNNIKRINSINEVGKDKYYIIDIRKLKTNTGLINVVKYREHPWDCLYVPMSNYKLDERKYSNLLTFMYNDYINYTKWVEYIK